MKRLVSVASVLLILALGTALCWNWLRDNKLSNFSTGAELYVTPGMGEAELRSLIAEKTGLISEKSLERSFKAKEVARYLKPGHYTISAGNSSVYVARMFNNAWQTPVKLTLSGNLRLKGNIAAKIASQMLLDSATVRAALDDKELLAKYGFTPKNVFSLLMPDTYDIFWTASMEEILDRQKDAYDAFWTEENIAKAKKLSMSREQVSILASIVKGETNYEPEMPRIAGVYLNRLKCGWPLQADPTVAYCFDYKLNRVLNRHLEVDSPYNTYRHNGLPPGPICVPTRACLEAVLNPDFGGIWGDGNMYFCASAAFDGTHDFARTLAEHNANANAFRAELNRRAAAKKK